jgi:hypothetical protein
MTAATFIRKFRYISVSPESDRLLSCDADSPKAVHMQTLDHVKVCSEINKNENVCRSVIVYSWSSYLKMKNSLLNIAMLCVCV